MRKEVFFSWMFIVLFVAVLAFLVVALTAPSFKSNTSGSTIYLRKNVTSPFYYNFSLNVSNPDNSVLTYTIYQINSSLYDVQTNSFFSWISLNSSTGVLSINATNNTHSGRYSLSVQVFDTQPAGPTEVFHFVVSEPPIFTYLCDNEKNNAREGTQFNCVMNVSDADETGNITLSTNYSWFKFNNSINSINLSGSNGNFSAVINFTATDAEVGNWSVNITAIDSFGVYNSTFVYFYINNTNDEVILNSINNLTAYTTNDYVFYVNASDNDLLITGKNVYNESIAFYSNTSWVNVSSLGQISGTNITQCRVNVYSTLATSVGNWSVEIRANDSNNFSTSLRTFVIQVFNNTYPVWNSSMQTNYSLTEGQEFYLNLSRNVTDLEGDSLYFSFRNSSAFSSFSISSGVINMTPVNADVGYHLVTINASDGKVNSTLDVNFTVYNVNNNPFIRNFSSADLTNATLMSNLNITIRETNLTQIIFYVEDSDFLIPVAQRNYYNESLNYTLIITGNNTALFNITPVLYPPVSNNISVYQALFTPNFSDVGFYSVNLNFTDFSNLSYAINFNITVINSTTALPVPTINTPVDTTTTTSSSGGGGGSRVVPVVLKLVFPGQVYSDVKDRIIIPISLVNDGKIKLNKISLRSSVFKNGIERPDIKSIFDVNSFDSIDIGKSAGANLIVDVDTSDAGEYEINIFADVESPVYKDTGKITLIVKEGKKIEGRIVFTEQLIASNPQCAEVREMVNRARDYLSKGNLTAADLEINSAVSACTKTIAQKPSAVSRKTLQTSIFSYTIIGSAVAVALGLGFYYYRRYRIARVMKGY